ncbi:conserved hypothetical protein [Hahella chejuensis KCTC 2396]|uniref:Uncharacterized protein n=2 Tax=Hahella chejuensis TaxID=158327 RepID=Q2SNM2_HAHCH|nr:conserved hypothetical protein [Hahella chejuensis KCTC 2396]
MPIHFVTGSHNFRRLLSLLLLLFSCVWALTAHADTMEERRIRTSLKLFRAMLAADQDIESKKTHDDYLKIVLIYANNSAKAEFYGRELLELGEGEQQARVRGLPIRVEISNDFALSKYQTAPPAGVFVIEKLFDDELRQLIQFGVDKQVVLYSPFEGDVAKGVLGGLAVEAHIKPYINLQTLAESQIRIKAFFLKVAKTYGP